MEDTKRDTRSLDYSSYMSCLHLSSQSLKGIRGGWSHNGEYAFRLDEATPTGKR